MILPKLLFRPPLIFPEIVFDRCIGRPLSKSDNNVVCYKLIKHLRISSRFSNKNNSGWRKNNLQTELPEEITAAIIYITVHHKARTFSYLKTEGYRYLYTFPLRRNVAWVIFNIRTEELNLSDTPQASWDCPDCSCQREIQKFMLKWILIFFRCI